MSPRRERSSLGALQVNKTPAGTPAASCTLHNSGCGSEPGASNLELLTWQVPSSAEALSQPIEREKFAVHCFSIKHERNNLANCSEGQSLDRGVWTEDSRKRLVLNVEQLGTHTTLQQDKLLRTCLRRTNRSGGLCRFPN